MKQSFSKNELAALLDAVLFVEEDDINHPCTSEAPLSKETVRQLKFKLVRLLQKIAVDTVNGDAPAS